LLRGICWRLLRLNEFCKDQLELCFSDVATHSHSLAVLCYASCSLLMNIYEYSLP
jgi:hypothetical protein